MPHPSTVDNGGDPTGLVLHVRWTGWGSKMAIGTGTSTYVWPGTAVAHNGPGAHARIVAFHLGTCRGKRSYNAVEWYFPKYDETFDPRSYINTCTHAYVGVDPKEVACPKVPVAGGTAFATEVGVVRMSCVSAGRLIRRTPAARYVKSGGRFIQSGFRCGTEGAVDGSAIFDCQLGQREFLYEIAG